MDYEIKLTLKVKGVEIELSPKDAEGLYEALGKLVDKKEKEYIPYPAYPWRWYPWITYTTPITPIQTPSPYIVYCSDKANNVSLTLAAS